METLVIAGKTIQRGTVTEIEMPVARLYTDTEISIPIHVICGRRPGPTLFVSAAIHGDELNGIEIIRRIITRKGIRNLQGTLITVPIVNIYGVLNQSRYMPDRRDLNRSFPGSTKGSLAGRVANLFLTEIVQKCDFGIDLHTGAIHRSNLPQIRADLSDEQTRAMAESFGVPVLLNSTLRDGSLRECACDSGTKILLYEAGEALRFDELSIRAGVNGILNVLSHLGMIKRKRSSTKSAPFVADNSAWIRAPSSGIVRDHKKLGDFVTRGTLLADISDPFGRPIDKVLANRTGVIIGKQNIPLAQEGDAMFHIAFFNDPDEVAEHIEIMQDNLLPENSEHPSQ
ncbi:succinylglutamate desuccinylase/aspartoacylase family protein [Teredinibacter haidensis]|uniref:succinylglutamate desuccinylase/aspartoacylase family protein n=1 Tax=Teredinibacter haidensis TaxID=2731755 RepID=UPI000948D4F5|nr:succinylglutamate desuccinylase/aspartoacylase family protein [Teredinibacter haidensis]